MRVSRTVKDYIIKEVIKKYEDKVKSIGVEYDAKEKEINDMIEKKMNEFNAELITLIAEKGNGFNFTTWRGKILGFTPVFDTEEKQKIRNERQEMEKEIEEKYTDIILTLELGGTKADLERMLSEL